MPIAAMAAATVVPHSLADMARLTPAAVTPAAATVVVVAATLLQRGRGREASGETGQEVGAKATNLNRCPVRLITTRENASNLSQT
jgi:hypothetical protein